MEFKRVSGALLLSLAIALAAAAQSGQSGSQAGQQSGSGNTTMHGQGSQNTGTTGEGVTGVGPSDAPGDAASGKRNNPDATNINAGKAASMNMRTVSRFDRDFMMKAAAGGVMELQLANAAQQKASNQQVKDFARQLAQDHTKANNELTRLMESRGLSAPNDPPAEHADDAQQVLNASGSDFDKKYMQLMLEDHQQDVEQFRKAAQDADDPQVKAFASKVLPTLEQHLQHARHVAQQVGVETSQK